MAWYGKYEDNDEFVPKKKEEDKSLTQRYLNKEDEETPEEKDDKSLTQRYLNKEDEIC